MNQPKAVRIKGVAIPPGSTLAEILVDTGVMPEDGIAAPLFQANMQFTDQEYGAFMGGSMPWTMEHCYKVARFTNTPVRFWLQLEHNYRADLANGLPHIRDI